MRISELRSVRIGIALCAMAACGCALFQSGLDMVAFWPTKLNTPENPLPPLRPARDAMQIEIVFVERPVGDPLLGNRLWSDIDKLAVAGDELDSLKRLGLRVGNAGMTPCPALEQMLELTGDPVEKSESKTRPPVQTIFLSPSGESPIETNSRTKCTVDVPTLAGVKEKTYENFKSELRMTAHRLQDGWARLEFVPEIHFGVQRVRPIPSAAGSEWEPKDTQEVDSLMTQKFSVKLQVGEMVLITTDAAGKPHSFGHQAFVKEDPQRDPIQRVLVVRLANMSRIDPVYSQSHLPEKGLSGR